MKAFVSLLTALTAAMAVATVIDAQETLRCSGGLVSPGLTTEEILGKCGQPNEKEVIEEPIRARNAGGGSRIIGTAIIERWIYVRASGQFPTLLHNEEGELKRVEFLTRK
jgi:hypothetical protein